MMKTEKKKLASYGRQIKLDKTHAQVLIELGSEVNIIGKARKIIEEIGVRTIQTLIPSMDSCKVGCRRHEKDCPKTYSKRVPQD